MAFINKFCNPWLTGGANDGTTELNAWQTIGAAAAGYAAGDCVWFKQGNATNGGTDYKQPGAIVTFGTAATATNPIMLRGYMNTIGDRGLCKLDMEANMLQITGVGTIVEGFDIKGTRSNQCFYGYGANIGLYRCKFVNNGTGVNTYSAVSLGYVKAINCSFEFANTDAAGICVYTRGSVLAHCIVKATGATSGKLINALQPWTGLGVISCLIVGTGGPAAYGIFLEGLVGGTGVTTIHGNTIHNAASLIYLNSIPAPANAQTLEITNNLLSTGTYGVDNPTSPYTVSTAFCSSNATYNVGTPARIGDMVDFDAVALTADPFVDAASGNFALNNAAGGGALCRAAAIGADMDLDGVVDNYLSIGAMMPKIGGGGDRRIEIG